MQSACAVLYCSLQPVQLCNSFPRYLINDKIYIKTLAHRIYVLWVSTQILCKIFIILRKIERGIVRNIPTSSYKVPIFLIKFLTKLELRRIFSKNTQITNVIKIRLVRAELFHVGRQKDGRMDRQIDIKKLIVVLRNFTNAL